MRPLETVEAQVSQGPDELPGVFKKKPNRAGATEFVAPELVAGTLERGFDVIGSVHAPFHRALSMMFLIAEVHPFTDGNGRIARVMMNAELQHAGEARIIVPTVYRNNHLSALRAATHSSFDPLFATLHFAQRYTGRIDFTDRATAEADLDRTNAFRDANEADAAGSASCCRSDGRSRRTPIEAFDEHPTALLTSRQIFVRRAGRHMDHSSTTSVDPISTRSR